MTQSSGVSGVGHDDTQCKLDSQYILHVACHCNQKSCIFNGLDPDTGIEKNRHSLASSPLKKCKTSGCKTSGWNVILMMYCESVFIHTSYTVFFVVVVVVVVVVVF